MVEDPTTMPRPALRPLPAGGFRCAGPAREDLQRLRDRRLLHEPAIEETEETFRVRVDDRLQSGVGRWQGEFWGKWMLGACAAARALDDGELRRRIGRSLRAVVATQDPDGYLGTYHDPDFLVGNTWNVWGRKYTLWGLLAGHELLGEDWILQAAGGLADHLIGQFADGLEPVQTGRCHGLPSCSIMTPLATLHRRTGEARYRAFAERIARTLDRGPDGPPDLLAKGLGGTPLHEWFPAAGAWAKCYELLSCVEGFCDLYAAGAGEEYLTAARNIHRALVRHDRSLVGSVSFDDKILRTRHIVNTLSELCDAVYWLRLSLRLFGLTGEAGYANEAERTACNAMACGLTPDAAWGFRRFRLSHEHVLAQTQSAMRHWHCCVANLPRGFFQWADHAVLADGEGLAVAHYLPGRARLRPGAGDAAELGLTMETAYPHDGRVRIVLQTERPRRVPLRLRLPGWCEAHALRLNGAPLPAAPAAGWLTLDRSWEDGDVIELDLAMPARLERFDAERLGADHPVVTRTEERWWQIAYNPEHGETTPTLGPQDVRPHAPAVAVCKGPVVLSRDRRLGQEDILKPLRLRPGEGTLQPLPAPPGVRRAYRFDGFEAPVRLSDFASAGSTGTPESCFNTWLTLAR